MSESNPVSTAIRRCFAAAEKECLDAVQERDQLRDLCVELLGSLRSAKKTAEFENHPFRSWHKTADAAITKAESILGEKNG